MPNDNTSIPQLVGLNKAFLSLRTTSDLAEILAVSPTFLAATALQPRYHIFDIPKKNGEMRRIEDPDDRLQPLQDGLNDYLQAVYWMRRSDAAYGFLVVPNGDPSPRHIETNAARHLGNPWLLNADLEDFFHQITEARVKDLFSGEPFHFDPDLADLLARITTFKGRCPMGAPTSPVLSNLVFAPVDEALLNLAGRRGWTYSRYADDMSFSSHQPINWDDYTDVQRCVGKFDFVFNQQKAKLLGPDDSKTITGLLLGPTGVEIPHDFIPQIAEDIRQLTGAAAVQFRVNPRGSRTIDRFRRSVEGKIRFAGRIMGDQHPGVTELWKDYRAALEPPTVYEARSWLDFDYF
jgi:RNA-directed DNA polymerase